MIDDASIATLIRSRLPDAQVRAQDYSGTQDHFNITIRSAAFAGQSILQQHQLVYRALRDALDDGRIHAVQLTTIVAEGTPS